MKTHSNDSEVYIGRKAGEELIRTIKNAKSSVKIVSPYLTPKYVEELIEVQKKGVQVTLLTADEVKEGYGNYSNLTHRDLIRQEQILDEDKSLERSKGMKWSGLSTLLIILWGVFGLTYLIILNIIISGVIFAVFYSKVIYTYKYHSIFTRLKLFYSQHYKVEEKKGDHLIHSKLYVIDENVAYVGSVNYTYDGTITNYECLVRIDDLNAVSKISNEIEDLYNSDRIFRPIDKWGKKLYDEPAH